jgi:hypothetical protein
LVGIEGALDPPQYAGQAGAREPKGRRVSEASTLLLQKDPDGGVLHSIAAVSTREGKQRFDELQASNGIIAVRASQDELGIAALPEPS